MTPPVLEKKESIMLRSILNRVAGGRSRATGGAAPRRGPTTGGSAGGSANREIEQGAKSLFRGFSRRKRGL